MNMEDPFRDILEQHPRSMIEQVREILKDVLPSKKMDRVSDSQIMSALEKQNDMDPVWKCKYYPNRTLDLAVRSIVSSMVSPEKASSDPEKMDEVEGATTKTPNTKEILIPLSRIYPDIDLPYLRHGYIFFQMAMRNFGKS